ncbi:TetR/AcrR family transcriptional regulator [Actinomycetospora sp. C-140]
MTQDGTAGVLLWHPAPPPARGPRRGVSLADIARAAMEVADAEGFDAVSMQRVASRLHLTKMALYRYVSGKPELTAVMLDEAVEEPPVLTGPWRARAEEFARLLSAVWTRHPWIPQNTVGDRLMGPREVGWVEAAVDIFTGTGLEPAERLDAASMLFGQMRVVHSAAASGTRPWTVDDEHDPLMRRLLGERADRYPAMLAAMEATPGRPTGDVTTTFGLTCLLDGLERVIDARAG